MTELILSFVILASFIIFYILYVGLLNSHSASYYKLNEKKEGLGALFSVTLFSSSFLLMLSALDHTPEPFKFTAFFSTMPVMFTAVAPRYIGKTIESKVHYLGAKVAGVFSFIWACWMSYAITWWLMLPLAFSALVFFLLNLKYKKPILFFEYALFLYPYMIIPLSTLKHN